jgi:hypothetical protein
LFIVICILPDFGVCHYINLFLKKLQYDLMSAKEKQAAGLRIYLINAQKKKEENK